MSEGELQAMTDREIMEAILELWYEQADQMEPRT